VNAVILSKGLDTNGQNHRFGRAAAKYGTDPDVLKALVIGKTDPAGVVGRFQLAAEKYGSLNIRSAHKAGAYFEFPDDLVWNRHTELEIKRLVGEADVVHLNNSYSAATHFRVRKPMLLHHHGSLFRKDPPHMHQMARHLRMLQAVSTPDLLQYGPGLHWLPTAYDVDELMAFREEHKRKPDGRIRIVHAPTNREYKATDVLIASVKELVAEGLPIDLVLVEGVTWRECLLVKATADIVFDQLAYGYGCNAVEAWAMGIPVISGSDEWTSAWMRENWGDTPYEEATADSLTEKIRQLVDDNYRATVAAKGMAHVRKYHDEKPALERLAELYGMAIAYYPKPVRIPGKGITFRNRTGKPIYDDEGGRISFEHGIVTVEDPYTVQRLRTFATKRPGYGIEEVA
jgi:hypothetical protein